MNFLKNYSTRRKYWQNRAYDAGQRFLDRIENSSVWLQRLTLAAVLAVLIILFERMAPALILGTAGYILLTRTLETRQRFVRKIFARMSFEPEPILPVQEPATSNVIPINNSFTAAWQGMDDFLRSVLDVLRTEFRFQTANIFLREDDPNTLVQRAYSTTTNSIARLATIRVGHGLVGWVAQNKRPIVIRNLHHEGRSMGYYRMPGENIASFAAAPIIVNDELLGVISLDHVKPDAFSSPQTEEALVAMAGILARVLGAEEVMEDRKREADRIRETRRILRAAYESEDLDAASAAVLKEIVTLADFHSLACYLLDQSKNPSRRASIGFNGIGGAMIKDPIMKRAVAHAATQCSPFKLEGLALQAQYRAANASSSIPVPELLMAMPILHKGEPLGALVFELMEKKSFDERLEGILDEVAHDLGGALVRTYRSAEAAWNATIENEMIEFSKKLIECDGLEEVWERLFSILISKTGASAAAAFRVSENGFIAESVAGCTPISDELPRDEGLLNWTVLARKPVIVGRNDRRTIPIVEGESFISFAAGDPESPRSVVVLASSDKNAFTEASKEIVESLVRTAMPIISTVDKLEAAHTALETDAATGLMNEFGVMKRIGVMAMNSAVSTAVFSIEGFDRLVTEFGRKEASTYLRRAATLIDNIVGRRGVVARLEGARFCVAMKGDASSVVDEIVKLSAASSIGTHQNVKLKCRAATASTDEGLRWEELIDACDGRLNRERVPQLSAVGAA